MFLYKEYSMGSGPCPPRSAFQCLAVTVTADGLVWEHSVLLGSTGPTRLAAVTVRFLTRGPHPTCPDPAAGRLTRPGIRPAGQMPPRSVLLAAGVPTNQPATHKNQIPLDFLSTLRWAVLMTWDVTSPPLILLYLTFMTHQQID